MRKRLIVFMVICLAVSFLAGALGMRGGLLVSSVGMDQVNLLIANYNDANETELPALSLAWGGEVDVSFGELAGMIPLVGGRGLSASSSAEGVTVSSSVIGVYAGGAFRFGPLEVSADVGAYRGGFSFPAARYENLSGWGAGIVGKATYSLRLTSALGLSLGLGFQWLTVPQVTDAEGGIYVPREGPFLDFSGLGLVIGLYWAGS
ncbi:hypothetical protein KAX17_10360 [Candidatus Bipolaricaulota bacterium]|nr:hypothetical protein [Candidatus Bipolaricaulota bacterium]